MNNLDKQYLDLCRDILDNGIKKSDRTGTGTISVFGRQIRHKMSEGFPLLTTKKMAWKQIVVELSWFLQGRTDLKYLLDNDCHIWVGDAYKRYYKAASELKEGYEEGDMIGSQPITDMMFSDPDNLIILSKEEFIEKIRTNDKFNSIYGDLGKIYGWQWRNWGAKIVYGQGESVLDIGIDQIANLINELKSNPDSRRLLITAWNPSDLEDQVLPPCHYGFQVYTRELSLEERAKWLQDTKGYDFLFGRLDHDHIREVIENESPKRAISLMWNQRSVDTALGLPFNIASYGLLLEILAKTVNMVPDELIGNLGDTHIYLNQIDGINEQLSRENKFSLPQLRMNPIFVANLEHKGLDEAINGQVQFELDEYQSHSAIPMPLSN